MFGYRKKALLSLRFGGQLCASAIQKHELRFYFLPRLLLSWGSLHNRVSTALGRMNTPAIDYDHFHFAKR